jgi:hypothetical protein
VIEVLRARFVAAALMLALPIPAAGGKSVRPVAEQTKIDFLLGEVKNSTAVFIRNGREYRSSRAASHLLTKLNFAGKRVQTVRDFILGIASHSERTGQPYEIRWSGGRRQRLTEWLFERLDFYEKEHLVKPGPAPTP